MWGIDGKKLIMSTYACFACQRRTADQALRRFLPHSRLPTSNPTTFISPENSRAISGLSLFPPKVWNSIAGNANEENVGATKSTVTSASTLSSPPTEAETPLKELGKKEESQADVADLPKSTKEEIKQEIQEELKEVKETTEQIGIKLFDVTGLWSDDQTERIDYVRSFFLPGDSEGDDKDKKEEKSNKAEKREKKDMSAHEKGTEVKEKLEDQDGVELKHDTTSNEDSDGGLFGIKNILPDNLFSQDTSRITTLGSLEHMSSSFIGMLSGQNTSSIEDIVVKAKELTQGEAAAKSTLSEVLEAGQLALKGLDRTMSNFFNDSSPPSVYPSNIYYYVEHEDQMKNFAWKRRKHRFCSSLDMSSVEELDQKLHFANLCYEDSLEEIKEDLENHFKHELLFCDMESHANRPSHFISVKREQPAYSKTLEVTLCVRGTKTITDAITDLICEEVDYRGGKAHSGMLESAQYIAGKHREFLKQLCELSDRPKIKLTVIGHSLGAGVSALVALELNDEDFIEAEAFGFGTPAILSQELSESTKDFVTSVVADNDCVPRLSAATFINAIMDMGEYDWVPAARRDMNDALSYIHDSLPIMLPSSSVESLNESIENLLLNSAKIPEPTTKRVKPTLFPPGECVHFYRDGFGVSAVTVPCTFFSELDINRRMVEDHLYYFGYKQILLEYMRHAHKNHYFLFETDRLVTAKLEKSAFMP